MTNQVIETIQQRRSCRTFDPARMPSDEILQQIAEAGTWAPTSMGMQNPIILVVTNRTLRDRIAQANASVMGKPADFDPFYGAPCMMVVLGHTGMLFWDFDPAAPAWAAYNLLCVFLRSSVLLFFMVSGTLFLGREKLDFKKHLKRAVHMLVLYYVWSLILNGIDALFLRYHTPGEDFLSLVLWGYFHLWFLPTMAMCYCALPLLHGMLHNNHDNVRRGAILLAAIVGLLCAAASHWRVPVLRRITSAYVEISRNTPLLIQLFFIYYGLPKIGIRTRPEACGILGLAFLGGGYMAEAFRSGIEAVDRIQEESALSLGLTRLQTFLHVILPQAAAISAPAFMANVVFLMKETSVFSAVSLMDLMFTAKDQIGLYYRTAENLFLLVGAYLLILLPLSMLGSVWERRLRYAGFGT
jgi:polar amino acid transport system permease protein